MTIKIEKGIPIPPKYAIREREYYPWGEMEIGDSFVIEREPPSRSAYALVTARNRRAKDGREFICRSVKGEPGKFRIWRVK